MPQLNSISSCLLAFVLAFPHNSLSVNFNITSPPITNWGDWGRFQRCPSGTYVQGFQLKTQSFQGPFADDTAANGLRLFCGNPFNSSTPYLESLVGSYGNWGNVLSCYPGYVNGFQLRVEPDLGNGDDTSTNNIRVFCSNTDPNQYIEGDGLSFGYWGDTRRCYTNQGICGLQTQIENCSTVNDCTSLNNILTECCDT